MKLYELASNYADVIELMEDSETSGIFKDTLDSITEAFEDKADNIAKMIKSLEAEEKALKEESDKLLEKSKTKRNHIQWLKKYLENNMLLMGKTKFKTLLFSFNIQKNVPSLLIDHENNIPKEFYIEQEPKLDKRELLAQIKQGLEVPGVSIRQTESLRIK